MTAHTLPGPVAVAIDGTASGREALALGRMLAELAGAPLVLGAVYGYESPSTSGLTWPSHEEADRWLVDAERSLGEDARWRSCTLPGATVAHGLIELCAREDAALLVLGSSPRGALGRLLVGSTAHRVLHGAPCAVAIVPHRWSPPAGSTLRSVIAAVADAPESRPALALAAELSRVCGARLQAVTVVHQPSPAHPMFAAAGIGYRDWVEERRRAAEHIVHEAAAAAGAPAETIVLEGDPVARLAEVSRETDLLVLGSRRYGPLRKALLGSVSSPLVERAACPLLIVPRGAVPTAPAVPALAAAGARP